MQLEALKRTLFTKASPKDFDFGDAFALFNSATKSPTTEDSKLVFKNLGNWALSKLSPRMQLRFRNNYENFSKGHSAKKFSYTEEEPFYALAAFSLLGLTKYTNESNFFNQLNNSIELVNKTISKYGFLSTPLTIISNILTFTCSSREPHSTSYEVTQAFTKLPGALKYKTSSTYLNLQGMHLRGEINDNDIPFDFIAATPALKLSLDLLKNGFNKDDDKSIPSIQREELLLANKQALVSFIRSTYLVAALPEKIKDPIYSNVFLMDNVVEKSKQTTADLRKLIKDNKDSILNAIDTVRQLDNDNSFSIINIGHPWIYDNFFKLPYKLTANKRVTFDDMISLPHQYSKDLPSSRSSLISFAKDDMNRVNLVYDAIKKVIKSID